MLVLIKIGAGSVKESVSWIELTFANTLQRIMASYGSHPLPAAPLCIISSNSEEASQTITAAILLEDHVGFRSVRFKAYQGRPGVTPCMVGTREQESLMIVFAKAEQKSIVWQPCMTRYIVER